MTARNALDRMKQQGSAKAKENRTKRKVEKNKEYGKSGLSSSDMAYINGNYKKVASNKAYGYRQGVKKGEIVRGTESDWLSDGNIRRTTKVKENTSWKKPTNKKSKQKYAILSSHKWDKAKKFDDHLNTKVWDGIKTAKANQRKGKHISNAFEYGKGLLKDIIVDPAVDTMKSLGAIGSYGTAGIAGFAEDSGNVFKAIADPKRDYKYYSQSRSNIKENLKMNKESLNETGFGEDFSTYLKGAKQRGEEEHIRLLEEQGRHNEVKEYKKQIEKNKKRDEILTNVAGFGMDILAPTLVEDSIGKVIGKLGKNTVKSFKELKNGTASLATGILPEETAKLMSNSKKYAGKGKTGASDDVFFSGTKGNTSIDKKLDNEFSKVMDNVKDVVKKNPTTPNLGKFLDVMDEKPLKGTQRNIDGRTLNKKYTQTKDGYKPQLMREVSEVDNIPNGNVNGQYSMFGKDGNMDAYINNVQNPYARYERVINKYDGDVEGLINRIDFMDSHNADATLDYIKKTRPELYEQIVKGSDEIDEIIESTTKRKGYETQQKLKDDDRYFNTKDVNTTPKSSPEELFQKQLIKENNYKLLKETFNPKFVDNIGNISEREGLFRAGVKKFAENVSTFTDGGLEEASVQIKNIKYLIDKGKVTTHEVSSMLNDLFFDGKDVIRKNVSPRHANQLLDYVDDMIVKQANGVLEEFDAMGNIIPVGEGARKISASLTDYRYDEKMSNLASHFGVKNKAELTNRYKELQAKKKIQPLNTEEFYEYKELGDKIAKWDDEYKKIKYMSDEYDEYAKKVYGKSDGLEGYNKALDELADSGKNKRLSYEEFVAQQNTSRTALDKAMNAKEWKKEVNKRWEEYKLDLDGAVDERNLELVRGEKMRNQIRDGASSVKNNNFGQSSRARQEMLDEVGEHVAPKYTTQELHKQRYDQKILNHQINNIRKTYDLPKTKVNAKIKLQKGQKLKDLPPVKENLANLRKTIQKEIKYMFEYPDRYKEFEGAFKQVKLDYVNSLRSIGVPDDKYFHKVVALQNELKGKMNKILEGGEKNTPLLKMELQKLANRVDETFNEFDNVVLDKIDDVNIKTFNDVVTDLNKVNNPFDELLNKVDDIEDTPFNKFDDVDPSDFDSSIDIPTEEIDLMQELKDHNKNFFNSVEDIRNRKEIHKREEAKISKSMPKVSELFNNAIKSGMSKDEAMEFAKKTYEGMLKGDIKIPEIEFKLRKSNDGFVGYDRVGIKENISNTPLDKLDDVKNTPLDKIDDTLPKSDNFKTNPPKTLEDVMKEEFEDNFAKDEKELYGRTLTKGEIKGNEEKLNRRFYKDNEIYDMYKAWLNSWKKGLTVYNPGWHVQNFFQNKGQNYLALGADAFLPQTDARNILKKINGEKAKDVNIFDKKNMKSYSSDEISKLAQELGVIDSLGEDVLNARGIFPRLEQKVDNSGLMKWLGQNEQTARLNHFIKQIERGMSPEDASKSVNKYLFDYSKKNGVDDFVGDFIDPFWTFHKNNARLLYGSMYKHPGKINNIIRGTEGLENGIPEEQRQNEEYKYDKLQLPHANFTDSVNKDQYNYLYSENMFPDVEDAIPFEQDAIENKMNPLLRIALQQSRGEGNFGNKIVEKGEEAGWNEITMGQRLGEIAQDLNPFMPNLVNTYIQAKERQEKADEEKQSQKTTDVQILMDWINYITGNKGNFYRNIDF